ncbi:MAG: hypothetical protein A2908_03215 [Candidatus Staskawiczbacteria bacterium RIFCSPLOWO2_01_FULL_38_12b]|uniref:Uncharacterized protein n=1 Tax=Candidatus Staskawiczbacteria bacterium RIFCSPLOWO2_01_FULL_38_12b TaxID=1802214 RepID=A0A1G2IE31_9BACT|nr:MAG: hypothetical protein A2908_03215 [Candidatus Staskawiczbacteria bacterium RIFCSPLOWO2_01_FULL_38_12b]
MLSEVGYFKRYARLPKYIFPFLNPMPSNLSRNPSRNILLPLVKITAKPLKSSWPHFPFPFIMYTQPSPSK